MTAPARSVFAEPLAQARDGMRRLEELNPAGPRAYAEHKAVLAALDLIEQRASELEERVLLDLAQEMFPDFDFSGCYDADDLRQHLKGQVSSAIELRAAEMERVLRELVDGVRILDVMLREPAAKGLMSAEDYRSYLSGAWLGVDEKTAAARAALSAREEAM